MARCWRSPTRRRPRRNAAMTRGSPPRRPVPESRYSEEQLQEALAETQAEFRKQAERWVSVHTELELALSRYTTLFLDAPIAYVTFDRAGIVRDINNAAAGLLGTTLKPSIGKPFLVFVDSPDRRLFMQHLVSCHRNGGGRMQLRLLRPGGEPRPVELVSRVVYAPKADQPISQTIIIDVEAAHERDRSLARSEKRHREIVEASSEGICIVDENNDIVFANRRFAAMIGWPAEVLVGRSAFEFVPDEDRDNARDAFHKRSVATEGEEIRLRRADGSSLWATVSGSLMRDDEGRFTGMLRMYADATARHELLETRQTLMRDLITTQERERERIARELHDQMGQHIVALALGIGKLARVTAPIEAAQPVLTQLREIADLLGRDVHTLAFQLRPAALDHLGLAVALASYGEHVAGRSGVEIDVHCDDLSVLKLSAATQTGLYRITQEGITNAVKHARATRIILERRLDELILIVEDDGIGMPSWDSPSPSVSGFGISGMRERATLLGATLSIESSAGHGTTLYVRMPLVHHEQSAPTSTR
jgi:PAS domain S-box-containing protein